MDLINLLRKNIISNGNIIFPNSLNKGDEF